MDDLNYQSKEDFDLAEIFKMFSHHNMCSVSVFYLFLVKNKVNFFSTF